MNVFKNTKTGKKFILVIVLLILFNFCCPKSVHAGLIDNVIEAMAKAPLRIFFWMEDGLLGFVNDIFCDKLHKQESTIYLSPESIIKGKFLLMDANIFKKVDQSLEQEDEDYYYDDGPNSDGDNAIVDGRITLRDTITGWYYALRNFAIVALLSVLVYIGIRMIISTVAQDKAKYKTMFKDWFVALCLLFAMHYIMIGILNMSTMVTKAIGTSGRTINMSEDSIAIIEGVLDHDWEEGYAHDNGKTYTLKDGYAQLFVLGAILVYTVIFTIKYIKRMLTIIFLILIAPISCITYPIDKVSDGKAQAYNRWFQEFFFQVIIQPFHLLIYVVLVGSAITLASENVLYAIMCFAVMIPAEKFIKEMFGFKDKLGSPLGALAGGALATKAMSALAGKGKGGITGGKGENDSTPNGLPPRTVNQDGLVDGQGGNGATAENAGLEAAENGAIAAGAANGLNQGQDEGNGRVEDTLQTKQDNEAIAEGENAINDAQEGNENDYQKFEENYNKGIGSGKLAQDLSAQGKALRAKNAITKGVKEGGKYLGGKGKKALAIHDQRMAKKYGTTSRKKRWVKRAGKGVKTLAAATAVAGAATILAATGRTNEALGVVGGATALAGRRVIKGATGSVKDYNRGLSSNDRREKQAFNAFKGDSNQIDKAVYSYRKNHEGQDPNHKQLEQELEDRFMLSRYGLTDEQIDNALPSYQEAVENGKDPEIAASQAKYAANLAKWYSPKEFMDPKKMETAYNTVKEGLMDQTGCTYEVADEYARKYLTEAGSMHGLKASQVRLPAQTLDINAPTRDAGVFNSLGLNQADLSEEQIQQISNLNIRLHDAGYDESQIRQIASTVADGRLASNAIANRFENVVNASIEYIDDGKARSQAESLVRGLNAGGKAPKAQVDAEMRERFVIKSTMGVKKEKDISAIRDLETEVFETKTDTQVARQVANQHRGKLRAGSDMTTEKQDMINKLVESGSSKEKAKQDVENIFDVAAVYADPNQNKPKTNRT